MKQNSKLENLLKETPEAYYWIGFLMADGSFYEPKNTIKLSISITDKSHAQKYSQFINVTPEIFVFQSNDNYGPRKVIEITKSDKDVFSKITDKFDINSRKTYNPCNNLEIKNNDLFASFLIGFIDGDGCIYTSKKRDKVLSIECHKSWKKCLDTWFNRIWKIGNIISYNSSKIPKTILTKKKKYARIRTSNHRFIWFLKSKALELNLPILKRKWDKIIEKDCIFEKSIKTKEMILSNFLNRISVNKTCEDIKMDPSYIYRVIRKYKKELVHI